MRETLVRPRAPSFLLALAAGVWGVFQWPVHAQKAPRLNRMIEALEAGKFAGRRGFGGVPAGWMVKNPIDYYEKLADVWPLNPEGELEKIGILRQTVVAAKAPRLKK